MNKIVALWCHPRSMSTSVERLMRERGDFLCLHEPFMYHYYLNQKHRDMPYFEPKKNHPVSYQGVRDMIFEKAEKSQVFFKDMAYYINSDIINDTRLSKSVTHCFLIRNPRASIASYYKLDNEVTLNEIGIEAQWQIYNHFIGLGIKPVVVQAESLRKDPHATAKRWWNNTGLTYKEGAFNWDKKSPQDWEQVKGWHQESIQSTSLLPWTEEEAQKESDQFEIMAVKATHLRSYLEHHQEFYNKLKCISL